MGTASDIDIDTGAGIGAGTGPSAAGVHIDTSKIQTVGLGATAKDMHLIGDELQRITAGGLSLGLSTSSGTMTVRGVTVNNNQYLSDVVSLGARADDAVVTFATADSSFKTLSAQGDNGVQVQVQVTTTGTANDDNTILHLDGDSENNSTGDANNKVTIADT